MSYVQTDADRRYSNLLRLLETVVGDDWQLVHELDEVVGLRLVEAQDQVEAGFRNARCRKAAR